MIKLTILLKRKEGLSQREFLKHWREVHAPLVLGVHEFTRHIRQYTQGELESVPGLPPPQYDGVVELSFDSIEALGAALAEPRYYEVIRKDEERFIDHSGVALFVTSEVSLLP
jgi:uncharacterized protein (TIGR02118 family)